MAALFAVWPRRHELSALGYLAAPLLWVGAMASALFFRTEPVTGLGVRRLTAIQPALAVAAIGATVIVTRAAARGRLVRAAEVAAVPGIAVAYPMALLLGGAEGWPAAPVIVTGLGALVASGLPAARWRFAGFLPRRAGELRRELARAGEETLVAYESPRRLAATLATLAELDPERPAAVCRELTKLHEEVVRGNAAELAERFAGGARGEVVLVVGPGAGESADVEGAREAVERLVEAGAKRRAAASVVASLTGVPANTLYGR